MTALRLIKAIRPEKKRPRLVDGPTWPNNLPPPVLAMDNRNKALAVSALCNLATRDGERVHSSDLTDKQAADVAAWLATSI